MSYRPGGIVNVPKAPDGYFYCHVCSRRFLTNFGSKLHQKNEHPTQPKVENTGQIDAIRKYVQQREDQNETEPYKQECSSQIGSMFNLRIKEEENLDIDTNIKILENEKSLLNLKQEEAVDENSNIALNIITIKCEDYLMHLEEQKSMHNTKVQNLNIATSKETIENSNYLLHLEQLDQNEEVKSSTEKRLVKFPNNLSVSLNSTIVSQHEESELANKSCFKTDPFEVEQFPSTPLRVDSTLEIEHKNKVLQVDSLILNKKQLQTEIAVQTTNNKKGNLCKKL